MLLEFDITTIEALQEDQNARVGREVQLLDRGVLTINELRRQRQLPDVPWGDTWAKAPMGADQVMPAPDQGLSAALRETLIGGNHAGNGVAH